MNILFEVWKKYIIIYIISIVLSLLAYSNDKTNIAQEILNII